MLGGDWLRRWLEVELELRLCSVRFTSSQRRLMLLKLLLGLLLWKLLLLLLLIDGFGTDVGVRR